MTVQPHSFFGVPCYAAKLSGELIAAARETGLAAGVLAPFVADTAPLTVLRQLLVQQQQQQQPPPHVIFCRTPKEFMTVRTLDRTEPLVPVYAQLLFLQSGQQLPTASLRAAAVHLCVLVVLEQRSGDWFACPVAFGGRAAIRPGVLPDTVALDGLVPCCTDSNLGEQQRALFTALRPLDAPLLPAPRGQFDGPELLAFVRSMISFCIRWHCARHSRLPERRALLDAETLPLQLYARTPRFFVAESARVALFGSSLFHLALNVVMRLSSSSRLRSFLRGELCSAFRFLCAHEVAPRASAATRDAVLELLRFMAETAVTYRTGGAKRDVAELQLEAVDDNNGVRWRAFALSAKLGALLFPSKAMLLDAAAPGDIELRRGRLTLSFAAAAELLPCAFERYIDAMKPRVGALSVALYAALKELGDFPVDLDCFDAHLPFSGQLYADDRPLDLDDAAFGTVDFRRGGGGGGGDRRPFRLSSYDAADANGLRRPRAELQLGSAAAGQSHCVPTSNGPLRVPQSAIHAITHRRQDAVELLGREDSADALRASTLRKSGLLLSHSQIDAADYANDPDSALRNDAALRDWLRELLVERRREQHRGDGEDRRRRRRREHIAIEPESDDGVNNNNNNNSAAAAATTVRESVPSPPASLCSSTGPNAEIEDMLQNLYHNRGVPLCVLRYARENVEEHKHAKDAARTTYYPFLRSLELPGARPIELLYHMMRNVDPGQYSEYFARFTEWAPKYCNRKRQQSKAGFVKLGEPDEIAERKAMCFPRCGSQQRPERDTCPLANVNTPDKQRALRAELAAAGLGLVEVERVMQRVNSGRPSSACKQFFEETRPDYGAEARAAVPFYPPGPTVWINHPRDFTYLAAMHMEASLRSPPGYQHATQDSGAGEDK